VREGVQRVPATEVLLNNSTVADKIREAEDDDLPAVIHSSEHEGMHDFTSSLARLVNEDWVDLRTAERYAPNAEALRSKVRGIQVKAETLIQRVRG
jgi:twitching motility protein PilT